MAIIRCPHCGTANRAGSNFCNRCGTNLREDEERPPDQARRPSRPEPPGAEPPPRPRLNLNQPWLESSPEEEEEPAPAPNAEDEPSEPEMPGGRRLITGIQGLLEPVRIADRLAEEAGPPSTALSASPIQTLPPTLDRQLRAILAGAPRPSGQRATGVPLSGPTLHRRWLFFAILAVILLSLLAGGRPETVHPQEWPGVAEAYVAVEALSPDAPVLVLWAYDPATGGELDLIALPVVQHLLERGARLAVVSLLPGGPPSANRLIGRALQTLRRDASRLARPEGGLLGEPLFLAGGLAALPLAGQELTALLPGAWPETGGTATPPALGVVLAAQAEDVQQWLEQIQPRNGAPLVAVTSAAADPLLRPYLDSGQLVGLVSGYDGAYSYGRLYARARLLAESPSLAPQIRGQRGVYLAVLAVLALGNLAALIGRETGA
jgi:hypothetical protein